MSFRKALWASAVAVCLFAPMAARAQGDYLSVFIFKVKPEKSAEFEAVTKKAVEANRRNHGDTWVTLETVYGEGGVYQITSTRKDYAEEQSSQDTAMAAVVKAYGKETALKMMQDFDNCIVWSRSELRRRRWDLSRKVPTDPAAFAKFIGESRFLRTTVLHVRPGHVPEFEAMIKEIKEAGERNADAAPVFVSQVVEGSRGATFYVSTLRTSLGGFDHNPTTREILGEEGFKKFQKINADALETVESTMYRFAPQLSNPPEEVAQAAADFWHPKTGGALSARTAKPKAAAVEPAASKEPVKKP